MTEFHLYHFIVLVCMVPLCWKLPTNIQLDGIAFLGNIFLLLVSPIAAMCLFLSSALVFLIASYQKHHGVWVLLGVAYCAIQFLLLRYLQENGVWDYLKTISILGIAYYTCRNIHYLIEAYKGRIVNNLRYFWYYQSFLPVMVTGPINRYPDFLREVQRRNFSPERNSYAIERIIYGYAKVVIIGNYLISFKINYQLDQMETNSMLFNWLSSAADWAYLYAQFSGWSDIAIGFSLLMGIKINENFNYPFKARNIIDFWQRWHISLSMWCKDYVFIPFLAMTRNPFCAVTAAMFAMGIWHELSIYYVLWGVYHAFGIAICRMFQNQTHPVFKNIVGTKFWPVIAWMITLNFIISGPLVIGTIDQWIFSYV